MLIFAGATKVGSIDELIEAINEYDMLPQQLAMAYGHVLPYLELVIGVLLILGLFLRVSAAAGGLVVLSFSIAKIQAIARGLDIDSCGCFGPGLQLLAGQTLAIDFLLLAMAVQIFFRQGDFLAIGPRFSTIAKRFKRPDL
jgi:uncharacterized membrane protein YphA (DoxX/SURF4 family)